jgi:hypothetical protein
VQHKTRLGNRGYGDLVALPQNRNARLPPLLLDVKPQTG